MYWIHPAARDMGTTLIWWCSFSYLWLSNYDGVDEKRGRQGRKRGKRVREEGEGVKRNTEVKRGRADAGYSSRDRDHPPGWQNSPNLWRKAGHWRQSSASIWETSMAWARIPRKGKWTFIHFEEFILLVKWNADFWRQQQQWKLKDKSKRIMKGNIQNLHFMQAQIWNNAPKMTPTEWSTVWSSAGQSIPPPSLKVLMEDNSE